MARHGMILAVETRGVQEEAMPKPLVTLNEESLRSDLREFVRKTVEDTLNGMLERETNDAVGT